MGDRLPIYLPNYHDIDVFVENAYLDILLERLRGYGFNKVKRVSEHKIQVANPLDSWFIVDINLIDSISTAEVIVSEALYNINRVGICNGKVKTYKGFSLENLMNFEAKALPHRWDYLNFSRREKSEEVMLQKLSAAGYIITPLTFFGKCKQTYYKLQAHIKRFFQRKQTRCRKKKNLK